MGKESGGSTIGAEQDGVYYCFCYKCVVEWIWSVFISSANIEWQNIVICFVVVVNRVVSLVIERSATPSPSPLLDGNESLWLGGPWPRGGFTDGHRVQNRPDQGTT